MKLIKRIKILDSLRGLAAIIVVLHHVFSMNVESLKTSLKPFLFELFHWISDRNVEAVLFFFIVSGFSIGLSLNKNPISDKVSINDYLYRRAKRILPLYWISLSLSSLLLIVYPYIYDSSYSIYNLIGNLFFLQTSTINKAWFIPFGDNGPLWSLSYEVFFYLIAIPILVLRKKYFITLMPQFLIFISLTIALGMIFLNHYIPNPFSAFLSLFPLWLFGFELSQIYISKKSNLFLFLLLIGFNLITVIINVKYFNSSSIRVLNSGIILSIFIYITVIIYKYKTVKIFLNPVIQLLNILFYKIGSVSFSIYILHYVLLKVLNLHQLNILLQFLSIVLLVFICYFFEKWLIKLPFLFFKRKYV